MDFIKDFEAKRGTQKYLGFITAAQLDNSMFMHNHTSYCHHNIFIIRI